MQQKAIKTKSRQNKKARICVWKIKFPVLSLRFVRSFVAPVSPCFVDFLFRFVWSVLFCSPFRSRPGSRISFPFNTESARSEQVIRHCGWFALFSIFFCLLSFVFGKHLSWADGRPSQEAKKFLQILFCFGFLEDFFELLRATGKRKRKGPL